MWRSPHWLRSASRAHVRRPMRPFRRLTPTPRDGSTRACAFSFADRATIARAVLGFKPASLTGARADLTACVTAILPLYGYPYSMTHTDGPYEDNDRNFRRLAAGGAQAGGQRGRDPACVGGTRAASGHRRNEAAAFSHARRAFQRELAPPRRPRLVVGPDTRDRSEEHTSELQSRF